MSANAAEVGDNLSDVDASVEGPSGVIAFNVRYLSDVLTNTKSQQIALEMHIPIIARSTRVVGILQFVSQSPAHDDDRRRCPSTE